MGCANVWCLISGDENDWKDSMNRDVPDSVIASAREVNLCLNGETQSDKTGNLGIVWMSRYLLQ